MPRSRLAPLALAAAALVLTGCGLLFPPRLAVAPTSAVLDLALGSSTSIVVANEGATGSSLRWRFESAELEAWPASGTLTAGAETSVAVFAPGAVEGRSYGGRFVAGRQEVAVTVSVVRGAALTCDPETAFAAAVPATARVLVGFEAGAVARSSRGDLSATATSAVAPLGGVVARRGLDGGFDLLEVPTARLDAALAALRATPGVRYAVPDGLVFRSAAPLDPYYDGQWNLAGFGAETAWDVLDAVSPDPEAVVLAVVDDGVAVGHPDLAGRLLPGFDVHDDDPDPRNCTDHGTHVAGIAGAGRGDVGVAGVASVPWVRVLPVKAWPDTTNAQLGTSLSSVLYGIRWAAGLAAYEGAPVNPFPADVVNLSLGIANTATYADDAFRPLIAELRARGVVVVAASGNVQDPGAAGDGIDFPAASGALAVGSVDADFERSAFSKFGAGLDLVAPGGFGPNPRCGSGTVVSTGVVYAGGLAVEDWTCKAGTSMATPFVAGAAALLVGVDADVRAATGADRVAVVEDRLLAAAARGPGGVAAEYGAGALCLDALFTGTHVCGDPVAAP